jgi:hypothetical protein
MKSIFSSPLSATLIVILQASCMTLPALQAMRQSSQQASHQAAPDAKAEQLQAMKKLAFMAGHWGGPVTITQGPGEPLKLTQTEEIQFKLDGLVMLVEGTSRSAEGKVLFNALATIAFDESTHSYHIRAYHDGHYIDTELTVVPDGFSWSFPAGPGRVANTMHLTAKGEWAETTDFVMGGDPPRRSVEMLLQQLPDAKK